MDVWIKSFDVKMEVKTNGMELEVRDNSGQVGDCYVNKTGLTWCRGRTRRAQGIKLSWAELQEILASAETKRAALASVRGA